MFAARLFLLSLSFRGLACDTATACFDETTVWGPRFAIFLQSLTAGDINWADRPVTGTVVRAFPE